MTLVRTADVIILAFSITDAAATQENNVTSRPTPINVLRPFCVASFVASAGTVVVRKTDVYRLSVQVAFSGHLDAPMSMR